MSSAFAIARDYFFYVISPLWIAAGFADWWFHRRTRIEETSGFPESLLHAVMLAEVGIPALIAVFFEFNSLVLALMLGGLLAHTVTTYFDLRWAHPRREIGPGEQMAHGLLLVLPLLSVSLAIIASWPAVLSLAGWPGVPVDFALRSRAEPLMGPLATAVLAPAMVIFIGLPYAEELWRTWRAGRVGMPVKAVAHR